ncbi:MAG: hypothetical protein WD942_05990 [Dehalococcoidia bacterium]
MKTNRTLLAAGYGLAVLLMLIPVTDTFLRVWPTRVGEVAWRYGAMGLASNALMTPVMGLAFGIGTALFARHRRVLRALAVLTGLGVTLLVVLGVGFVLDLLRVRSGVSAEALSAFDVANFQALLKISALGLVASLLAIGSWVASRSAESPEGPPGPIVARAGAQFEGDSW